MKNRNQAIKIVRRRDDWSWTLFDAENAPVATGAAAEQQAAMEAAWRTARTLAPAGGRTYPEILVESASGADASSRAA